MQIRGSKYEESLRWLAVLPGALIAVFLARYAIYWIISLLQNDFPFGREPNEVSLLSLISPDVLEMFVMAFFAPYLLIFVGATIAPRYKFRTSLVLAGILAIFYIFIASSIGEDISSGAYTVARWIRLFITIVLCVAGFSFGLYRARKLDC
jgi:hypothetical protein